MTQGATRQQGNKTTIPLPSMLAKSTYMKCEQLDSNWRNSVLDPSLSLWTILLEVVLIACQTLNDSLTQFLSSGGMNIRFGQKMYNNYESLTDQTVDVGGNISVSKPEENCMEVYFPSTTSVLFCEKKGMLSIVVTLTNDYKNATKGLLGTWNENPDDDYTLPDGTTLSPTLSSREIHFGFGLKCKYCVKKCSVYHKSSYVVQLKFGLYY